MSQRTQFITYQPKTIFNKGKRADHWFWTRYSAYPYKGCQHGCAFCYSRERKYIPYKPQDPEGSYDAETDEFSHRIMVKENAAELLRKALRRAPVDLVFTGDYQAAEKKYKLSRQMLEVCLERGFPVFVLTRSPLVLRDLDLFQEINRRARAVVVFSVTATPESALYESISRLEGLAPKAEKRFSAMRQFASAGILTGTAGMPLLPGLCDDAANIQSLAKWTADNGGKFVLGGGLTLSDQQKLFFVNRLGRDHPELLPLYDRLYPQGSYGQAGSWQQTGMLIYEACQKAGISDRIPRPIISGEKRAVNKRIVEQLAYTLHMLELENASQSKQWAYRKAAWSVEDLEQDIRLIYQSMGRKGLESIPNISPALAGEVEKLIEPF